MKMHIRWLKSKTKEWFKWVWDLQCLSNKDYAPLSCTCRSACGYCKKRLPINLVNWSLQTKLIACMLGYLAQHFALTRVTTFKMNTVTTEENLLLICRGPDKLQGGEGEWSGFKPLPRSLHCIFGLDTLLSQCLSPPRCVYKWVCSNLMLGATFLTRTE